MIPIFFSSAETDFTHNGIGRLIDCISCTVTEERNGIFEVEFSYPVNGRFYSDLLNGGIIGVIHDDSHDIQPFDIYKHSASIEGVVTFNARHISYRLGGMVVSPFTASSASGACSALVSSSVNTNPFSITTDISDNTNYKLEEFASARAVLMGEEDSLLTVYGGELKFDKFSVSLLASRGTDNGVTVRYGKNLTGIEWERDTSGTFNAIAPYWTDGANRVTLPEYFVQPTTPITPIVCVPFDMSWYFDSQPTEAQLRTAAVSYLDRNEPWKPYNQLTINFVAMWETPEYESIAPVQRVNLCDEVSVYWTEMGIVAEKTKVVRCVFNVLSERFDEITLGTVQTEFVAITSDVEAEAENAKIIGYGSETSGNVSWTYRHWSDGTVEAWGKYSASIAVTTSGYGGYRSAELTFAIPQIVGLYDENYIIVGQKANANGVTLWSLYPSSKTAAKMYLFAESSQTQTCTINAYIKGRWKA